MDLSLKLTGADLHALMGDGLRQRPVSVWHKADRAVRPNLGNCSVRACVSATKIEINNAGQIKKVANI